MAQKKPETGKGKGKIEKTRESYSFDFLTDEDYSDGKPSPISPKHVSQATSHAKQMKTEALEKDGLSPFRGKLRALFRPSSNTPFTSTVTVQTKVELLPQDYVYIQMKLGLDHLPPKFLEEIETFRLSGITIRKASGDDLAIFVKLYNRAFMRGADPWSPATEAQFADIINHKTTVVLIAESDGEDVGFIITDLEGVDQEIGVIVGLGTDPRWQRHGIGRFLGITSWDYFRKLKVKELRCEVYENNLPSYNLIKGLNFQEYGKKVYSF